MPIVETTPDTAERIRHAFAARITPQRFYLWFPPNARFVWLGTELLLVARQHHFQEWAAEKFGEALRQTVREVCGAGCTVRFLTDPQLFAEGPPSEAIPTPAKPVVLPPRPAPQTNLFGEVHVPLPAMTKPRVQKPVRKWKSFSEFAVGVSNRVAYAAAVAAAEEPGLGANPLVLHGPVGTGKTHLLEAAYTMLRKLQPEGRPLFIHAEEFANRFGQAIRYGKMQQFRRQFRDATALFLDDLHFLETKVANQEELLHTLDALMQDGCQVMITTDCHPRLSERLLPELVDRLVGGAVWSLLPPDDVTRMQILQRKALGANPVLPEDVLKFLARNLKGNVRELEGAVNALRHFSKVTGQPLTITAAREALGDLIRQTVRATTIMDVEKAVLTLAGLPAGTMQSKARTWSVTHPRMVAVYLARKHTTATYGEIAKHFGLRQHSTAVAGEKKVRGWLQDNQRVVIGERPWNARDLIERLERELFR
ncbi:MAG: DnaA ATPase domain-containing protein [Gemmataceae bacterium]